MTPPPLFFSPHLLSLIFNISLTRKNGFHISWRCTWTTLLFHLSPKWGFTCNPTFRHGYEWLPNLLKCQGPQKRECRWPAGYAINSTRFCIRQLSVISRCRSNLFFIPSRKSSRMTHFGSEDDRNCSVGIEKVPRIVERRRRASLPAGLSPATWCNLFLSVRVIWMAGKIRYDATKEIWSVLSRWGRRWKRRFLPRLAVTGERF